MPDRGLERVLYFDARLSDVRAFTRLLLAGFSVSELVRLALHPEIISYLKYFAKLEKQLLAGKP